MSMAAATKAPTEVAPLLPATIAAPLRSNDPVRTGADLAATATCTINDGEVAVPT